MCIVWIKNHPHLIHYINIKDSLFVKIDGTLVKKQMHILQILVQDLQNDVILPKFERNVLVQEKFMENYVLGIHHLGSTCQNIIPNEQHKYYHMWMRNLYKWHDTSIRNQ